MVLSSVPLYLDPPTLQQRPNRQHPEQHVQVLPGSGTGNLENHHQHLIPPPLLPQPPPPPPPHVGMGWPSDVATRRISISMAERARLLNIRRPQTPLKCPRCGSLNTKFCYYNNYQLSQPRHSCKTCKRYWTDGGALRNVPFGGRHRRNRRSSTKSSNGGSSGGGGSRGTGVLRPSLAQIGMGNQGLTFIRSTYAPQSQHHHLGGLGGLGGGRDHRNNNNQQHQINFNPGNLFEVSGGSSSRRGMYLTSFQNDQGVVVVGEGGGGGEDDHENVKIEDKQEPNQVAAAAATTTTTYEDMWTDQLWGFNSSSTI